MRWVGALLVCVLSGVVTALAFPPYDVAWLVWFSIAPALAVTASASPATAFAGGLLAPFRAVEHHRWLVRVASSGISLVVDPYGRVVKKTGIAAGSVLDGEVALRQDQTLYTRYGYHLPHVCLLVTLGLVLLGLR